MTQMQPREIDLFRVGGVQIGVDYSWLLIFALVFWSLSSGYFPAELPGYPPWSYLLAGFSASLLFFTSVLVHEMSHAMVANRLGESVRRITLFMFGGMAHLSGEPRSPATELRIAAVGPLTSIALGEFFYALAAILTALDADRLTTAVFSYLGFVNLALALFNLLPGFPLDGGRLLRAGLWRRSGDLEQATRRAAKWGNRVAAAVMALGALQIAAGAPVGGTWLIFIGLFLRGAASGSYRNLVVTHALDAAHVRDLMVRDPVIISPETTIARAVADYFLEYGYGGFPVGSAAHVEGIVSLPMVRRCRARERDTQCVRNVMRRLDEGLAIGPDTTITQTLQQMVARNTSRLVVIEDGRAIGLITRTAILHFVELAEAARHVPTRATDPTELAPHNATTAAG